MKGTLETINYMSLRIEEYIDKCFEQFQVTASQKYKVSDRNRSGELAIINLQKAHLINECMRNMVENLKREE